MIIDGALLFSSAQAVTATAVSTNVIDLTNARDMGVGDNPALKILAVVTTAMLSAGATTLTITVEGSTDNSSWTVMASTPAIAKANLTAGAQIMNMDLPRTAPGQALPRYLRLNYTVAVSNFTAGAITASLVLDRDDLINYPAGINISN